MTDFEPAKHLSKVQGRDYLEVKWRIVRARAVHPEVSIQTELVRADDNGVTFRAEVAWPNNTETGQWITRVSGYAYEPWSDPKRFGGAIENAETSAIGRALGAAGFGTQFSNDHEFGVDSGRVVDSPVQRSTPRPAPPQYDVRDHEPAAPASSNLASNDEIDAIGLLLRQAAMSPVDARTAVKERYGKGTRAQLTHDEAQDFMAWLRTQMPHEQPALVN